MVIVEKNWWNKDWQGKQKYSEKTCPSATFVHHKSHMMGHRGRKPATNRLSYGAAYFLTFLIFFIIFIIYFNNLLHFNHFLFSILNTVMFLSVT
jgi:hypothetical protein